MAQITAYDHRIWSKRKDNWPRDGVMCDRTGPWGNPFIMTHESQRNLVCDQFEEWLETGKNFGVKAATETKRLWILAHIRELMGRDLICWCRSPQDFHPKRCHCETLARRAHEGY